MIGSERPLLSTGAMNMIAALLEQRAGQQISADRAWRIETALKPIMRDLHLETLEALVRQLFTAQDANLRERVVDALLNQETSFFRDAAVLDLLGDAVSTMQERAADRRLRIWSAGCSTGQEPLSLAMLLSEVEARKPGVLPAEIVATDVSQSALDRAKAGHFSQFEIQRGLPVRRMITWFDGAGNDWVAKPALLRRLQFRRHNLTEDPAPPGRFDIILCRNVLLYFSPVVRRRVFDALASAIRPGGMLVLGAGETVIGQTDQFAPCTEYRGFYRAVGNGQDRERLAAAV